MAKRLIDAASRKQGNIAQQLRVDGVVHKSRICGSLKGKYLRSKGVNSWDWDTVSFYDSLSNVPLF